MLPRTNLPTSRVQYLRATSPSGGLRIAPQYTSFFGTALVDEDRVEPFSGASLLRTSGRGLPAEDIFLDYWTLLEIERVFENSKRLIGNRPVRHRLEDRIGAYVLPCSLGVLLVRVAEQELFRQGSNEYTPQHVAAQDLTDTRRRDLADQGNPENNAGVVGHTQGKGTS